MSSTEYKWGFCRNCVKNVPHDEWHTSPLFRFLDNLTYQKLRLLRIGPWHCIHCENQSIILRPTRDDAVDYRMQESEFDTQEDETSVPEHSESVGNFIREDESLILRSNRLKRFSEKYRDAVVRRILKGSTTMTQVRQDMNVSETELVDWISDIFDRQQAKLDALENVVDSHPQLRIVNDISKTGTTEHSIPGGVTVDGHVKPK